MKQNKNHWLQNLHVTILSYLQLLQKKKYHYNFSGLMFSLIIWSKMLISAWSNLQMKQNWKNTKLD